jgi:peptidoglycan/xylan/chitin deacetylase (PgdA/CDA1 family)
MLEWEVKEAKCIIEEQLAEEVRYFAYPYGYYDEKVKAAVRAAGYQAAVTARSGFNGCGTDLFELKRIDIFGTDSLIQFSLKIKFGANEMSYLSAAQYYGSRVAARFS